MKNSSKTCRTGLLAAALLMSSLGLASAQNNSGATTGIYDENTFATNTVDSNATSLTSGMFATAMATAFSTNQGGIINFDNISVNGGSGLISATYGTAQSKTISLGYSDSNLNQYNFQNGNTNVAAISGITGNAIGNYFIPLFPGTNNTFNSFTLTLGTITGGSAGEGVTQTGFTLLGRNANPAGTATVTALFSNATTAAATRTYTGSGRGTEDTFFGFTAPSGAFIQSITVSFDTIGAGRPIDDFGFITAVPEPSTYVSSLAGLGLMFGLYRSRRVRTNA